MRWLTLHLGGQKWSVFLVGPRSKFLSSDEGRRLMGRCDFDTCRIYVSKSLEEGAREDTLLHELLHALLFVSGAEKAYNGSELADEHIVSCLTPVLHRLLRDLGFRFPRGLNA